MRLPRAPRGRSQAGVGIFAWRRFLGTRAVLPCCETENHRQIERRPPARPGRYREEPTPVRTCSAVYGSNARCRARLIACASARWCLAQVPDLRRDSIRPRSERKRRRKLKSLKSMAVIFSTHMTQARRRPRPKPPPPRRRWPSPPSRSRGARRSSPRSGATAARAGGLGGSASGCLSAASGCSGAASGCSSSAAGCSGAASGPVSAPGSISFSILTSLERDLFRFDVLRRLHRLVLLRQRRAARPVQEQHPVGDDLRAIALLTVRGIPGAGALATLDIHPAALLQELAALLRQLTPGHHAEPFGLLASLTVRGGIVAAGSHPKAGQGVAVGSIAHLRIRSQITDDQNLVEARHLPSPFGPSYSSSFTTRCLITSSDSFRFSSSAPSRWGSRLSWATT